MFNKIIQIISVAILALAFSACSDSLGIDPNVQKDPIISNPGDEDSTEKESPIYEIRDKEWLFAESIYLNGNHTQIFEWYKYVKYQRNSCRIDTSKDDYALWIDLDAECTYPDAAISNRDDRVTGISILIDSLIFPKGIHKIEKRDIRNLINMQCKLYVKDLKSGASTFYIQDQFFYSYIFEIDRTRNTITFNMIIWILYMEMEEIAYDTEALQIMADFHY